MDRRPGLFDGVLAAAGIELGLDGGVPEAVPSLVLVPRLARQRHLGRLGVRCAGASLGVVEQLLQA